MLLSRAIALQGIGFGRESVSLQGFRTQSAVISAPKKNLAYIIDDDEDLIQSQNKIVLTTIILALTQGILQ